MGNPYTRNGLLSKSLEERIADHVRADGSCLVWTGAVKSNHGGRYHYGSIYVDGVQRVIHRVAWEVANGAIPKGMEVGRTCRNTLCVSLQHMFLFHPKQSVDKDSPVFEVKAVKPT